MYLSQIALFTFLIDLEKKNYSEREQTLWKIALCFRPLLFFIQVKLGKMISFMGSWLP